MAQNSHDPSPRQRTRPPSRKREGAHTTEVFGVQVQPLKDVAKKVGPLARKVGRQLADRLNGR
jgi:hypothetical protein